MHTPSLRGWLFLVSLLFAVLVVGGISLTTYVIVSDGMQVVAYDSTQRVTASAVAALREAVAAADRVAEEQGQQGEARRRAALRDLEQNLAVLLGSPGLAGAEFALYSEADGDPIWYSSEEGVDDSKESARARAVETGSATYSGMRRGSLIAGLLSDAELGVNIVHVPVPLPDGGAGVLDVTYLPHNEEAVIDSIRVPMAILAVSAMVIMVVLMQTSMAWVLNLVGDLRRAADSIEAGRLDERLPDEADNEIGELARSINGLIERLQRRSEAQGRFVADASHELATPVAGIRGYTSILRAWGGEDRKVREEAIDAIDRESQRMARLTSDLLNLLHADQGLRLKSERFDLNVLVRERLATTASRYLDKDIDFEGPEAESLVMVGDADRTEDVLSILLDNAGKYTPPEGRVSVQTARKRDTVVITVADTGEGVVAEDVPRLFDRFFRSEKARAEGEGGFGLGLAIAKSIVDSMGGSIEVQSTLGVGTTFEIVLPRGRV